VISFPGRVPEGQVRGQFAAAVDFFPTIAEFCGVQLPKRKIDGVSLSSVLHDPQAKGTRDVYHWQLGNQWAVRDGNWKLVVNGMDTQQNKKLQGADQTFLSDMSKDVTERHNLAADHPDVVAKLTKLHEVGRGTQEGLGETASRKSKEDENCATIREGPAPKHFFLLLDQQRLAIEVQSEIGLVNKKSNMVNGVNPARFTPTQAGGLAPKL